MGEATRISWTQHTYNPWVGCHPVSPGCANCYMHRQMAQYGRDPGKVTRTSPATFNAPLRWHKRILAEATGFVAPKPERVFACSWSDWFLEEADPWRPEAWAIVRQTPHLTYQILTKRPERIAGCLPPDWGQGYPNVWLGATVEDQQRADERIPLLLSVSAVVHWVSAEPLLGPIDLGQLVWVKLPRPVHGDWPLYHHTIAKPGIHSAVLNPHGAVSVRLADGHLGIKPDEMEWCRKFDWVVCGSETGPGARPCDPAWIRAIVGQCQEARVPVWLKQLGHRPERDTLLDGREWRELPEAQP